MAYFLVSKQHLLMENLLIRPMYIGVMRAGNWQITGT